MKISWLITRAREGQNKISGPFFYKFFLTLTSLNSYYPPHALLLLALNKVHTVPGLIEPSNLEDSFKDTLRMQHTPKAKNLNRSEFQYFVLQQKSEKINRISNVKNIYLHNNNDEKVLRNR